MDYRDRQRQPLPDAGWKPVRQSGKVSRQIELPRHLHDAYRHLRCRQPKQSRMQLQILMHGELGVEREGLRHEADAAPHLDVGRVGGVPEYPCLPFRGRQQPGEHLHGRGLAAAVGADKAEDLAAVDTEAHVVDRGKRTEAPCQIARLDGGAVRARDARRHDQAAVVAALLPREQRDKRLFQRLRTGARPDLVGPAHGEHSSRVHRDQPVEPLRFFHVGRGHDHAHLGPLLAQVREQLPELATRKRIDPGGRLVQDHQIGVVDKRAT